jgi:glyoxylase-like metal-dependent hydrolase (beta-lactamase superfamily II)
MKPVLRRLTLLLPLLFPQISRSSPGVDNVRSISELTRTPEIPQDKGYLVRAIRDGLYWLTDGAYGTIFLVYAKGVIAVDPLPTLGPRYLKAISEVTDRPVTHVIYSHEHIDHIGAAHLFPRNAIFIAHEETAAILARRKDPHRPVPNVTFDKSYSLIAGEQTLVLRYEGINHELGNIFIYAPRQKVLMLVDVVYPGFMPYKNLGIAEDVQGYIRAHTDALAYDFDIFVGGHVNRLGTREDVETAKQFVDDLSSTAASVLSTLDFPSYIRAHPAPDKWNLHNEYEKELVGACSAQLLPRWKWRLADTETYLRDNCWAMIEAQIVQLAPQERLGR